MRLAHHSLNFCGWKAREALAKELKRIYQATDENDAGAALVEFEAERGQRYPSITLSWRQNRPVLP